jgi:hypothetical protein
MAAARRRVHSAGRRTVPGFRLFQHSP